MSADGRSNSDGNIVLKGASSEAHSLWMSVENLRIRDDTEGQIEDINWELLMDMHIHQIQEQVIQMGWSTEDP